MDRLSGAVGACARDHRDPPFYHLAGVAHHLDMLLMGHGGRFSRGPAGDDGIGASRDLLLQKLLQLTVVYLPAFCKRRYKGNARSFKNSHDTILLMVFLSSRTRQPATKRTSRSWFLKVFCFLFK